jgi:hypothetical protein
MARKTKTELTMQSNSTFPDNTTGAITAANHRTFNNDLIDSVLFNTDLASATEQLTGEALNGKPVHARTLDLDIPYDDSGNDTEVEINGVTRVWLDPAASYWWVTTNADPSLEPPTNADVMPFVGYSSLSSPNMAIVGIKTYAKSSDVGAYCIRGTGVIAGTQRVRGKVRIKYIK